MAKALRMIDLVFQGIVVSPRPVIVVDVWFSRTELAELDRVSVRKDERLS